MTQTEIRNTNSNKASTLFKPILRAEFSRSIKVKLITCIVIIGLLTGTASIISNFVIEKSIHKLDGMIETTVLANRIINSLDDLVDVQGALSQYVFSKDENKLKEVETNTALINDNIILLKAYVEHEAGQERVNRLEKQLKTCINEIHVLLDAAKNGDSRKAIVKKEKVLQIIGFIKTGTQELIQSELDHQQIQKAELQKQTTLTRILLIVLILVIIILSITFTGMYIGKIAGAINMLANNAQLIAEGDLKVSNIKVKSKDEILSLAESFNLMGANLRSIIKGINKSSDNVANSAEVLKCGAVQSSETIQVISTTMQQVSSGAQTQSTQTRQVVHVIDQLLEGNRRISGNVKSVLETSDEAMHAAIDGNEKLKSLMYQIQVIQEKIINTHSITNTLKKRSYELEKVIDTVSKIASQTNLLSLNASIEAARAGEHGKGFTVVAYEIQKLANNSQAAVNVIAEILKDIKYQLEQVNESMAIGVSEVEEGTEIAQKASLAFEKIKNTSEHVDFQVKDTNNEITNMVKDIEQVRDTSYKISLITDQFSNSSQDVAAAVEEQMAGLQEVAASASSLSDMAVELKNIVSQFRL